MMEFSPPKLLLFGLLIALALVDAYTPLSDETLKHLPSAGADFDIKSGSILSPILIPRVPGTPGSFAVQQHLVNWFRTNLPKWTIEFQNSTSKTPATGSKQIPFVNIIVTRDPPWTSIGDVGRLAVVAHYDSKLQPAGFIGATDSAAPCAMIMHAARSVDEALTAKWEAMKAEGSYGLENEKGVQLLFLDGEEAFVSWTHTDSLYGARSLAEEWESKSHEALSIYPNALTSISLFFLLDLLGAKGPHIPSYFKTTHWAYKGLASIEQRMRDLNLFGAAHDPLYLPESKKESHHFNSAYMMEDDHIPFMARGVEVLHIIPNPFPDVWHNMRGIPDDGEHLDPATVEDWGKIVTAFIGEWMDLEGYFPTEMAVEEKPKGKREASPRDELLEHR